MTADELRSALSLLGLRQRELALLVGVTDRAVGMWLSGEREMPGPLVAYVRLLQTLPPALRSQELARLQDKEQWAMIEGLYRFDCDGLDGVAIGAVVFQDGRVFGSDSKVAIDGHYSPTGVPGEANIRVTVTVPPGQPMIQGVSAGHLGFSYGTEARVNLLSGEKFTLSTGIGGGIAGLLGVRLTKLRGLPN